MPVARRSRRRSLLNSDGYLDMAETEIPPEYEAAALRGASACPEQAIEIIPE